MMPIFKPIYQTEAFVKCYRHTSDHLKPLQRSRDHSGTYSYHCFSHSLPEFATLTLCRLGIFDLVDLIYNLIVATARKLAIYRAHVGCF